MNEFVKSLDLLSNSLSFYALSTIVIVNFGSFSNEGEFSIGADAATLMPFFCLISALLIFFHLFEETLVLQVRVLGTV